MAQLLPWVLHEPHGSAQAVSRRCRENLGALEGALVRKSSEAPEGLDRPTQSERRPLVGAHPFLHQYKIMRRTF